MIDTDRLVHERFFRIAQRYPENSALAFCDKGNWRHWSYRELAARARGLTAALNALGVRPGEAVGVIACRHPDAIASLIAILGAGAHFVPLDPAYPEQRLRLLCADAGVRHVLSAVALTNPQFFPATVHSIGESRTTDVSASERAIDRARMSPETPAYIMFTSGSTGTPKGVVVPHRAVLRLIDKPNFMRLDPSRVFLQLAPMGFDASTLEIWGPLLNGGTCVLYPDQQLPTASGLQGVIEALHVNSLWLTASLFNGIIDQDSRCLLGLDELLIGGEALSMPHVSKALLDLKGTQLINGYGPTENTTFTTCYRIPADFSGTESRVPIGAPISGTTVAIVDDRLRPVPTGAEGELIALGEGLALGYLNKPELTRERFVEITLADGAVTRGYRTGDRVVQRHDGLIDYLGRFDDQVKIDGHRIEPGEVERVVSGFAGIKECRILVLTGPAGQKRIAAYVVAPDLPYQQDLRRRLAEVLPAYLVPHFLVFLAALPINANGKLDKAALPDPFKRTAAIPIGSRPSGLNAIAAAWEEILGRSLASDDVNFFDAGGTSLEAVRLYELLTERLGRALDSTFVFEYSTIRRQAEAVDSMDGDPQARDRSQQRRNTVSRRARRDMR